LFYTDLLTIKTLPDTYFVENLPVNINFILRYINKYPEIHKFNFATIIFNVSFL